MTTTRRALSTSTWAHTSHPPRPSAATVKPAGERGQGKTIVWLRPRTGLRPPVPRSQPNRTKPTPPVGRLCSSRGVHDERSASCRQLAPASSWHFPSSRRRLRPHPEPSFSAWARAPFPAPSPVPHALRRMDGDSRGGRGEGRSRGANTRCYTEVLKDEAVLGMGCCAVETCDRRHGGRYLLGYNMAIYSA